MIRLSATVKVSRSRLVPTIEGVGVEDAAILKTLLGLEAAGVGLSGFGAFKGLIAILKAFPGTEAGGPPIFMLKPGVDAGAAVVLEATGLLMANENLIFSPSGGISSVCGMESSSVSPSPSEEDPDGPAAPLISAALSICSCISCRSRCSSDLDALSFFWLASYTWESVPQRRQPFKSDCTNRFGKGFGCIVHPRDE